MDSTPTRLATPPQDTLCVTVRDMSASQDLGTAATSRQALSVIFLGQNNLSSIAKRAFYAALAMKKRGGDEKRCGGVADVVATTRL